MKTNQEKYLKYYYLGIISSFIFIGGSFGILAFPKPEQTETVVYPQESIMTNQQVNIVDLNNQKTLNNKVNYSLPKSSKKEISEVKLTNKQEEIPFVELDYGKNKSNEEVYYVKEEYGDTLKYYANMYGLDENLVIAIATLRKEHNDEIDDEGKIGIMGITFDAWYGQTLTAYDFYDNTSKEFVFDDKIYSLEGNIEAGCVIFQNELKKYNYNILVGLQSYQYGGYYMEQVLSYYAQDNNKTYEQVLNGTSIDWMKYRSSYIPDKDSEYIEHVLSYYTGSGIIEMKKTTEDISKINLNKKVELLNKIKGL